jgi:hypothetical protein
MIQWPLRDRRTKEEYDTYISPETFASVKVNRHELYKNIIDQKPTTIFRGDADTMVTLKGEYEIEHENARYFDIPDGDHNLTGVMDTVIQKMRETQVFDR